MQQYHDLLRYVLQHGKRKPTRARLLSTGKHVDALSVFAYQTRYDLRESFPLLTTKKMAWAPIVHELLWFIAGDTNVRSLQAKDVRIWNEWADPITGDLGPIYGKQWRRWEGPNGQSVDQLRQVIEGIHAVKRDPTASVGRRLIVSAWNPVDVPQMKLPPCHAFFQFSVTDGELSCQLYQRSADAFLGVPFNIASYALLTMLVATVTELKPAEFIHSFGDLHIYENHIEQVQEQLTRAPKKSPYVHVRPDVRSIDEFVFEDIKLEGYEFHPMLRGEVAV